MKKRELSLHSGGQAVHCQVPASGDGLYAVSGHGEGRHWMESAQNSLTATPSTIPNRPQDSGVNAPIKALPSLPDHLWRVPPLNTVTLAFKSQQES